MTLSRAITLPDEAGSPRAARPTIRRERSGNTEERRLAEEAAAAWEDEGGAPGYDHGMDY